MIIISKESLIKDLLSQKKISENYIVFCIYKQPDVFLDNNFDRIDIKSTFDDISMRFYFALAKIMITKGVKKLDDISTGLEIENNASLKIPYEQFGGYSIISEGIQYAEVDNLEMHLQSLKKYDILIKLAKLDFPIERLYKQEDFNTKSIDQINEIFTGMIDSIFGDVDTESKIEDLTDGLDEIVDEANKGIDRGFPYESPMLTDYTSGMVLGDLTMLCANSGIGKTSVTVMQLLPKMVEYNEKILIMANEEDSKKWKKDIITWIVNNKLGHEFNRQRWRQGDFTPSELQTLKEGIEWYREKVDKGILIFKNFDFFTMNKAIKTIKKVSATQGVDYFVLDTLKLDSDDKTIDQQTWLQLQMNMVKLHDVIKSSNRNLHVFCTYQLGKNARVSKFLNQNSLGVAKNVVDVVSTLMLFRRVLPTEKMSQKNAIEVTNYKTGKPQFLDYDKDYFILFLDKNRNGQTNRQLIFEVDLSKNIMKDVGTCVIMEDF